MSINLSKMNDEELLEYTIDFAYEEMEKIDDQLFQLKEPFKTVAAIFAAQGVIDNGSLGYFFEADWNHNPPYSEFADAYERIGKVDAANCIRNAAASFGVPDPENHIDLRREFIEKNFDEKSRCQVEGWDDCICGDDDVFTSLASWIRREWINMNDENT